MKTCKVNKCPNHAPNLIIIWNGLNENCPLCAAYKANRRLAKRVEKLKTVKVQLLERFEKLLPNLKKRNKKRKKDDIPF